MLQQVGGEPGPAKGTGTVDADLAQENAQAPIEHHGRCRLHVRWMILRLIMMYSMVLSLSVCLWSVIWIRNGNRAGIQAGTTVGLLIFIVCMIVFVQFDRLDMLLFDSLRALLMVVFGVLAYQEHQKNHTTSP